VLQDSINVVKFRI